MKNTEGGLSEAIVGGLDKDGLGTKDLLELLLLSKLVVLIIFIKFFYFFN